MAVVNFVLFLNGKRDKSTISMVLLLTECLASEERISWVRFLPNIS